MVELDRALPALAANSGAPFAMSVRGKTYRERAEAAPVLVDSLGQAYGEGKRYGNTKEFPIAELRGVQVVASRMLSGDEMVVTLSVPGRSRSIQAKDFTGMDTASVGLVRRVENMVADTPNYRDELNRRHEHALTRIAELEAVADEPFEHTDTLRDKRHRLDTLTAALQTSADSPEAKAKAKETEHQQRLDAQGREPGWSLALNPTPALRAEFGDAELACRAGHGGGGSDTQGLVGAGVGAGPGGGTGVIGCAEGGPVGLSRAGQSEHRADRAGGGCAGTTSYPTAARGPAPRRGTRPVSRSANRLSRSGRGRLRRGVVVLTRAGVCSGRGLRVRGVFGGRSPASLSCFAVHPPASAAAWAVRAVSAAWCSASRAWVAAASCLRCTSRASPRVFTRAMRSASSVLAAAAAAALPDRGGVGSLMPPLCRTRRWPRASGRPCIRHRGGMASSTRRLRSPGPWL